MKRVVFSALVILIINNIVFAQQDPQYTHNMFNQFAINPGAAGCFKDVSATVISRQQWMGFDGAPTSRLFSVHTPINLLGVPSGVGLYIVDDRLGFEKNFDLKLAYSYKYDIWMGQLGIGVGLGMLNKAYEGQWKAPESTSGDQAIPVENDSHIAFDLGFGVYYKTSNFYLGFSSSHITQPEIKISIEQIPYIRRHYFLIAGYTTDLPVPALEISPSAMVKSDGVSTQVSLNANVIYNKRFWGGVTYRLEDAIIALAGIEIYDGLKIGLSYDITTSKINKGTTEVMIQYNFDLGLQGGPTKYRSVRFL